MDNVVKPYRDPVPGRGSIELRRTAAGVYSWVVTIWTDAIVTDAHLIGMVDSVERVDVELKRRYPESDKSGAKAPTPSNIAPSEAPSDV